MKRLSLLIGLALAVGCGSSEERPRGEGGGDPADGGGSPRSRDVAYHDEGYTGAWSAGAAAYEVADDGQRVTGTLAADPDGRWEAVEFQLARNADGFKGSAQIHATGGETAEVRWELLPEADGSLSGRQQTAWVDESTGEVLTFDQNPLWEPLTVSVERTEATAVAMVEQPEEPAEDPIAVEDPIEDDPIEDDPIEDDPIEDDPFADPEDDPFEDDPFEEDPMGDDPFEDPEDPEDDPFADEPDPFGDEPDPTMVDDPEDGGGLELNEEAREEAERQRLRDEKERARSARSAERRSDPEGLAAAVHEAIVEGDGELYSSCWIINDDARFLAGAREAEVIDVARAQLRNVWTGITKSHPGIRKSEFVRYEGDVEQGKTTDEVHDGRLVYRLATGEEKALSLTLLVKVEDGSWKVQDLEP